MEFNEQAKVGNEELFKFEKNGGLQDEEEFKTVSAKMELCFIIGEQFQELLAKFLKDFEQIP